MALLCCLCACSEPDGRDENGARTSSDRLPEASDHRAERADLVVYYSWDDSVAKAVFDAFSAEHGVKVAGMRRSSRHIVKVIEAEADAPVASVVMAGPAPSYVILREAGLLEPYRPEGWQEIPADRRDPDGMWTGFYVGLIGFVTDTRQSGGKVPRSYADLLTLDRAKGVVYANPATSGTAYSFVLGLIGAFGEEGAFDYLSKLHPWVTEVPSGGSTVVRVVEVGEATVGIAFAHDILRGQRRSPWLALSFPAEGTGWEVGATALLKNAPNPELGKAFIDFLIRPTTQELLWRESDFPPYPAHPRATPPPDAVALTTVKRVPLDIVEAGQRWADRASRWNRTFPRGR